MAKVKIDKQDSKICSLWDNLDSFVVVFAMANALDVDISSNNIQGSYGSWKTWKVLEFCCSIFQDWKVLEKGYWSLKVLEICYT